MGWRTAGNMLWLWGYVMWWLGLRWRLEGIDRKMTAQDRMAARYRMAARARMAARERVPARDRAAARDRVAAGAVLLTEHECRSGSKQCGQSKRRRVSLATKKTATKLLTW